MNPWDIREDEYCKIKEFLGDYPIVSDIYCNDYIKRYAKRLPYIYKNDYMFWTSFHVKRYFETRGYLEDNNNKASSLWFKKNKDIVAVCYLIKGKHHRFGLPATISYDYFGKVIGEKYAIKGKLHNRLDYAYREFDRKNNTWNIEFYINDMKLSLDEFCKMKEGLWDV